MIRNQQLLWTLCLYLIIPVFKEIKQHDDDMSFTLFEVSEFSSSTSSCLLFESVFLQFWTVCSHFS